MARRSGLSVGDAPELQAAVLALRTADREVRNAIHRQTRATLNPLWRATVAAHARTPLDTAVLAKGARIATGNPPAFVAATSTRALSGGLVPSDQWQAFEFGTHKRGKSRTYRTRSRNGNAYTVTRQTANQLPRFAKGGRVVYPAMAETLPRAVSLWVQTIVRMYAHAAEGETVA